MGDIKIRRLESVCYITRLEEERATKTVLNGKFQNTRSVGKPRIRWEDVVQRDALWVLGNEPGTKKNEEWRRLLR